MLETPYVFIDTQIYVASQFQYSGGRLARIHEIALSGKIIPVTTDVTVNEIISNIGEAVQIATGIIQKLRDKGRILANASEPSFANIFEYDEQKVVANLVENLKRYHNRANFLLIEAGSVPAKRIFDQYFSRKPPFGNEKKKSEFPDAFVLEALRSHCAKVDDRLYVVSGDSDLRSACTADSPFIHLESLEQLFELIATEDEELLELGHKMVEEVLAEANEKISEQFINRGFYIRDKDGDVNTVRVDNIGHDSVFILDVDSENISFETTATITFTAEVIYDNMENAHYDSEEGLVYAWDRIRREVTRELDVSVLGELTYNRRPPHDPDLVDVEIDAPADIGVAVDRWERSG